jgi:hypothetical protein
LDKAGGGVSSAKVCTMVEVTHSDEFFAVLHKLVHAWCDRKCLEALNHVLPAYLSFNGLTDAWNRLYEALHNVRSTAQYELTAVELEEVNILIRAARQVLYREPFAA